MDIKIFSNDIFGNIRVIEKDNQIWFVGKDIAEKLNYKEPNKAIVRHVDEDDRIKCPITDSSNRVQDSWIINESGMYSLVLSSKLESAKEFKRWVTNEVLPAIRKTGGYIPTNENDSDAEIMARALLIAQSTIENKNIRIKELETKIEDDKPLVTFADRILKDGDNILVRELAKIATDEGYKIREKKLYNKLREWNYICKSSTEPTQYSMERGYFIVETGVINTPYGTKQTFTTRVTPKGQIKIVEKLLKQLNKEDK